jgi:hypothetical protein
MKAVAVKTKADVYVLCEIKSLFSIQNSIILRPFTAGVAQIIIFWVITPCRRIALFRRFGRAASTFRLNLKKIFLGFKKNVFVRVMCHERGGARCTSGRNEIHSMICLENPEGTT